MADGLWLDELARRMAGARSRREMLRMLGAGMLGATLAGIWPDETAAADVTPGCERYCAERFAVGLDRERCEEQCMACRAYCRERFAAGPPRQDCKAACRGCPGGPAHMRDSTCTYPCDSTNCPDWGGDNCPPRQVFCPPSGICCPVGQLCAPGGGVCCPPANICTVGGVRNACCSSGNCVEGVCLS